MIRSAYETPPAVRPLPARRRERSEDLARYVVPVARGLFTAIFLASGPNHFRKPMIEYARQKGLPMAGLLVPLSGVMAMAGGLSVLLGYRAKIGGALLAGFLAPVTVKMHNFWSVKEPQARQNEQIHFMKNLAMLGGALLISQVGAGAASLDALREQRQVGGAARERRKRLPEPQGDLEAIASQSSRF